MISEWLILINLGLYLETWWEWTLTARYVELKHYVT